MYFFLLLLFMLLSVIFNYLFWWSCFLMLTMMFIFLSKLVELNIMCLSLFFLFQEVTGIMFLFNLSSGFQSIIILLKIGSSPLHFWLYYLVYYFEGYIMVWLFVLYKFCVLPVVIFF